MDTSVVAEWIRLVNVVTGIVAFTWLALRASRYWSTYSHAERILYAVVATFVLATIYASAEAIYAHLQFGLRTFVIEAADILLLWGLWQTRYNKYAYRRRRRSES